MRATSGADGRFHFVISRSEFITNRYNEGRWPIGNIVARAPGHAFGLAAANADGPDSTLQLARDMPVEGRIIDLEGRPVVGATVTVVDVRASANASLDSWLKAIEEPKEHRQFEYELLPLRLDYQPKPPVIAPVTTDSSGRFRIEGIGRERVASLLIEGSTIETAHVKVRTRAGATIVVPVHDGTSANPTLVYGSAIEHVAGPTRLIEGIVRDEDTGKPLSGMMVHGEWSRDIAFAADIRAITDAQGHYRLIGLPSGREGRLIAIPPCDFPTSRSSITERIRPPDEELPYLRASVKVEERRDTATLHLDIKMNRGVWLTGRIVDKSTGKPVDARLEYFVYNNNPHFRAFQTSQRSYGRIYARFVGDDGTFRLVVFPGPGLLAAQTAGNRYALGTGSETLKHRLDGRLLPTEPYAIAPESYHVLAEINPAPGTVSLTSEMALEAGRSVSVTVLDPDGSALADTQVQGLNEMIRSFQTPGTSTFTVNGLKPGKGRTLTFFNSRARLSGELVLRGDETGPRTITLRPWATIAGRIVNNDGEAVKEGHLYPFNFPNGVPKVGKDGRFRVEGLVADKAYTIHFLWGQGRMGAIIARDIKFGPGEAKDLGDVLLDRPKSQ